MFKYLDNTFFKFLFGFLAILFMSFAIILAARYMELEDVNSSSSYVEYVETTNTRIQN